MNESIQQAFNDQIQEEMASAYIYLSMAAYFEALNMRGFAHWMRSQAKEEMEHAMKFFDHINERGGRVKLQAISAPPLEFDSPLQAFRMAYQHEQHITGRIHQLYRQATQEADYPAYSMLQWFVDEQVEEEDNTRTVVERLEMVGDNKVGLLMLDRELGQR